MSDHSPLKETLKPSRIYPLVLIGLMFAWWQFYLQPLKQEKVKMAKSTDGYFKTVEQEDIFSAVFAEYKHTAKGKTMGVIGYSIHYFDSENRNFKPQIDSLLTHFNNVFSTYVPTSSISEFNEKGFTATDSWMEDLHGRTQKVYTETQGAFDPTVKPLVSFWGFGGSPNESEFKDSTKIDSLKNLVGYSNIGIQSGSLQALKKGVKLDYGAVAKGYGVDVVADFLEAKGITSYMVEIGGEIRVGASKPSEKAWILAVEDVNTYERTAKIFLNLENKAMATSGNYRNFRIDTETGEKYQHTIDPKLGYPVRNNLLSVTVITDNCLEADAYATALMVMGVDKSISFAERKDLEICLIYSEGEEMKVYHSENFKTRIL